MPIFFSGFKPSSKVLIETIKAYKFKAIFMLSNDFLQALLEGIVLGLTYNLLTVFQSGHLSVAGKAWLSPMLLGSSELSTKALISWLLVLISAGVFVQSVLKYLSRIAGLRIAASIKQNIVMFIARLMKRADYLKLQGMRTGNVITVCLESPEAIRQQFEIYANITIATMYLIVYVLILAVYSLNEFLVAVLSISIIGAFQAYLSLNTKKWSLVLANSVSSVNNTMADLVSGFKFLKSSSSMNVVINKVETEAIHLKKSYLKTAYFSEMSAPLGKALGMIAIGIIALMFIYSSNDFAGILPRLGIFVVALQRLIGKANEVFSLVKDFAQNRGRLMLYDRFILDFAADSRFTINNSPANSNQSCQERYTSKLESLPQKICIEHLAFRYPCAEVESLLDINAEFVAGDFVGIIGQSGSGKSTFIDVLTGLLSPSKGNIIVDDKCIDFNQAMKSSLASNLFLVDQEGFICYGTIQENIIWSSVSFDEERLWQCLKLVNLAGYVQALPYGLQTLVGEGGLKMSGGQSQRLCIARALYQDKQVLILDEATSSLDKTNEQEILERIQKMCASKIVIMITHNPSNLRFATKCLYFKSGSIAAAGSYQSILPYINVNQLSDS